MGLFSSSKKKADLPPEKKVWHIAENTSMSCGSVTEEINYNNIHYIIQEITKNHKELSEKMDKILDEDKELKDRCDTLEKTVNTFTR